MLSRAYLCEFGLFWFLGLISVKSFSNLIHLGLAIYMQSIYPSWAKSFMKDEEKRRLKKKKKKNKGPERGLESFGCYSASLYLMTRKKTHFSAEH